MPAANLHSVVARPLQIVLEQRLRLVIERDWKQVQPRELFQRVERDLESAVSLYWLNIIFTHRLVPSFGSRLRAGFRPNAAGVAVFVRPM